MEHMERLVLLRHLGVLGIGIPKLSKIVKSWISNKFKADLFSFPDVCESGVSVSVVSLSELSGSSGWFVSDCSELSAGVSGESVAVLVSPASG